MCKYVHLNGLKLSGALEEFSITTKFLEKNAKIIFLKKISVLIAVFIELKSSLLQTCLAYLKNTKHLIFCL